AEWIETRREMAVGPVGLDERHRRGHAAEQLGIRSLCRLDSCRLGCGGDLRAAARPVAARLRELFEEPGNRGMRRAELRLPAPEQRPPLRRGRFRDLEA